MDVMFFQYRYHTNMHPIVRGLKDNDHNVSFIVQERKEIENYESIHPKVLRMSVLAYPAYIIFLFCSYIGATDISKAKFTRIFGLPSISQYVRMVINNGPETIIIRNYYPTTLLVSTLSLLLGKNVVFIDLDPKYCPDEDIAKSKRLAKEIIKNVVNTFPQQDFVRITPILGEPSTGEAEEHSYYLPFPIDLKSFHGDSSHDMVNITGSDKCVRLMCVGKYRQPRKNHNKLINAVKQADEIIEEDLELLLVGQLNDTHNSNYVNIMEEIEELNMSERIVVKANVEHKEMPQMYSSSDIFVFPASREPLGISLLEAMAQGLPIICSDEVGSKGYIEHNVNGFIYDCDSVYQLRNYIIKLAESPGLRQHMGKESSSITLDRHHPDQFEESLRNLISNEF